MILLGRCDAPQQRANAENTIYNINNTADIDELIRISLQNAQIGFTRLAMNEADGMAEKSLNTLISHNS